MHHYNNNRGDKWEIFNFLQQSQDEIEKCNEP